MRIFNFYVCFFILFVCLGKGIHMSRIVRNQLISILNTLKETNTVLRQLLIEADIDSIVALLTDCQNCAIEMGNQIENVYGEGLETIHTLEQYCECLYQLADNLSNPDDIPEKYNQICKQVEVIKETFEKDVPYRKEIVFFPYKASMWDSLESVYLAAKEDKSCDAYCVPIPYFDRNADGSLGKMHYEGKDYPKNIEIINWETYDLETRRPDVVYIHNPYDEANRVTCVHPRFFSSNLKKYTEKLVYIPYFVLAEIEPDNQAAIDGMKHFITLPGVLYADKVILQSEKMRQIYINELSKAIEATGNTVDRKSLEEKVLGTGSPKLDKVKNTKVEEIEVPEDWKKILRRDDGTQKKSIFYNTTIVALLEQDEKMLEKIKSVLQIFKERQEDVVLIWRPHPLIESTIKSMRPKLWEEYSKIVEQYKEEGWGIYDDTPDMNKAIMISDAYYGDMSSVVQVYQETGKPVMVQNVSVL